jgi:hypothetical protein
VGQHRLVVTMLAIGAALTTGGYLTLIKAGSASSSLGTIEVVKLTASASAALVLAATGSLACRRRAQFATGERADAGAFVKLPRNAALWLLLAGVGVAEVDPWDRSSPSNATDEEHVTTVGNIAAVNLHHCLILKHHGDGQFRI